MTPGHQDQFRLLPDSHLTRWDAEQKPSGRKRDFAGSAVQSDRLTAGCERWQSVPSATTIPLG